VKRDLNDIVEGIAARARDGEEIEAYASRSVDTEVRVLDGDVESLSSAESQGVGVRVVAGRRQGFAYVGSLDESVIAEVLEEARDNAGFGSTDEWYGLPEPDGVAPPALDLYRDDLAGYATEDKVALATELERATRAGDPRIRAIESAEYGDALVESALASSKGVRASSRRTLCSVVVEAIAGEGAETQTGFGYSVGRTPSELDVARAASEAVWRATRLLGAKKPKSQRVTVIFEPRVTASFLGVLSSAFSGEAVLKGRSFFAGRDGEQVAVPALTLVDDPTIADAYGATPYDGEGLATRRNALIEEGVLRGFLHNTYTGRRSGNGSTGSAARAGYRSTPGVSARSLLLAPGDDGPDELIADADAAVLVQSVQGLHSGVNPVSGDFSVGVEGLMVRGGAVAEPVREATIASTIQRMLLDVTAVGSDLEWLPGAAAGVTLVVSDVTMSGA
jgi:PmbA protein